MSWEGGAAVLPALPVKRENVLEPKSSGGFTKVSLQRERREKVSDNKPNVSGKRDLDDGGPPQCFD